MKRIFTFFCLLLFCLFSYAGSGQLSIDGVVYNIDTLACAKVGPGTYYTALKGATATKFLRIYVLEIDAGNPYVGFESVLGRDSLVGTETLTSMATRKSKPGNAYFAGINGDFFATTGAVGTPTHGCITDGLIGRSPAATPMFAFSGTTPIVADVAMGVSTCTFGDESIRINDINKGRGTDELILYNILNGKYTHTNAYGTEVLLQLPEGVSWEVNKTQTAKVVSVESRRGNMKIEPGCVVLSGHGVAETFLSKLQVNDEVALFQCVDVSGLNPDPVIHTMMGADRFILRNGEVTDNDWAELHPRTCAGYSQDKQKIYFCVVDGRSGLSAGVRTKELADIIKSAGAYEAVNLDGGGSSAMYIQELGIMNIPSDGKERAVGNALYTVNKAPEDHVIAEIRAIAEHVEIPRYGIHTPHFYGYNQYGTLIDTDVKGVTISCDPALGTVVGDTALLASGEQNGIVQADYQGITTGIQVTLNEDIVPELRLDSVIADKHHPYPIEIQAKVRENYEPLYAPAFQWTVDDPSVCQVENGILTGISNGNTYIRGKLGTVQLSQKVKVEIPEVQSLSIDKLADLSTWEIISTSNIVSSGLTSVSIPTTIQYTYTSGRNPYVGLAKLVPLYSLPDTLKIVFNTHAADVKSATVVLRANNAQFNTLVSVESIPSGTDYTLNIPMSSWLNNPDDRAVYPVFFESFKLMLDNLTQVHNQSYEITIKEFALKYGDIEVSINDPEISAKVRVYPNPVTAGVVYIDLLPEDFSSLRLELFTLSGQKLLDEIPARRSGTSAFLLPLQDILPGTYLLNIRCQTLCETVKIIIQ